MLDLVVDARRRILLTVLVGILPGGGSAAQTSDSVSVTKAREAPAQALIDNPWSLMFYRASSSTLTLAETLLLQYETANEVLYVLDMGYTLPPHTGVSRFFQKVGSVFGVAGNVGFRHEKNYENVIPEFNAYATWRWLDLPWNRVVATTLAIGYGLSYATEIPRLEYLTARKGEPQKLMNFLMIEATLALPSVSRAQFVTRIHHRSGTFGLMGPERIGSNAVAFGLRLHP